MRVVFVFPYVPYKYAKTPYPSLGIGYLSAVLRKRCEFISQIELIDGQILDEEQFWDGVERVGADIVLISANIRQVKAARRVAEIVKKQCPGTLAICGGPGASALAVHQSDFFRGSAIDIIVKREAEELLPRLLTRIYSHGSIDDIPNLIINRGGEVIITKVDSIFPDITTIPWPDRSIFDEKDYLCRWQEAAGMTSVHIMGSRGCPFNCLFCDHTVSGRRIRYRDTDDVVAEMLYLEQRYHPNDIFYFDDLFTINRQRVIFLCQTLQEKQFSTAWSAQGRVDTVDEEMLTAMKAAGCTELMFGVESGSNRILDYLGKGFTNKDTIRAFDLCRQVGIKPGAYLIVGVPGETRQDVFDTISLVERIEPSLLNFSFLTPFPNTPLYSATQQWIGEWDYERWDDFDDTVYTCDFGIDPRKTRDMILDAYLRKIQAGMSYTEYQFANDERCVD